MNEDARTKQELLYECSSLKSKLSNEIIKNENLEQQCEKKKEKVRELANKIKFNEKSRRKMQQSLMKQIAELEQQCKKQKEVINKAINDLNIILEIVREQPSGSDYWIINRLEANKKILKEVSE